VTGAPPTEPIFEAFAVRLDPAHARSIRRAVEKKLGKSFALQPIAPALGEYQLVASRPVAPGRAWTLARSLRGVAGVQEAEPLFAYAGLEPDPARRALYLAPHEMPRGRRASGGEKTKECAKDNARWSLETIRAAEAWALLGNVPPGSGVRIGHPDTGYTQHPEIWGAAPGSVLPQLGYDFVDDKPDPRDPLVGGFAGHGTATGSVILSPTTTVIGRGVTGVAPAASLVPVRVSTSVIHFSFANLRRAVYHLVDQADVKVISMSLGGPIPSNALERALLHAIERGVIPLAAAGNWWPFVVYPAKYEQVVAVGASNCAGGAWVGSARGGAIDISAPGESVWRASAERQNGAPFYDVQPSSGTSYAVATTAGACALWLAYHGHAALFARYGATLADTFRRLLGEVAFNRPNGWDAERMGPGVLDAKKLLEAPLPPTAAGVRSRAPRGVLEAALDYFPGDDPDRVHAALTRRVPEKRGGRARSVRRAFAEVGDELLFHLGTSPALRAALHAEATAKGRRSTSRRVRLDASREFHAKLGL
jgi:hypothetical protein